MRKKVISLFIAILFVLNCFYPTLTFASPELEAEMFFKYYDISADAYVEEDESLLVGEEYELEVWLKDMGMLFGGCIPVHFNNDVVRIAAYESGEELTEELIGVNAANHIYVMGDWKAEIITTGIDTPVISNTRGLVSVNFCHTDNDAYELSGESRIFSVRFKVIAAGDTEFREATEALDGDDADLVYAPEGAYFAGIDTDGEEYEIEFLPSPEAKYAGYAVERVTLDKETLDLVIGASETLNVTVEPDNAANKKVVWKSDNEAVATVDENGVVTGVATGEAQITVTSVDGGYIDTCKVTVIDENTPTVPQGLTITSKTGKSVEFSWSASTGKSGVDGYNVYRDGELIATVDECKFLDDTGTEGVEYVYTVEAFYGDLVSSASDGLTVILESPKIVEVVPESQEIFGSNQAQKVYVYYKDTFNSDGSSLKVEYKANGAEEYTEYTLTDEEIETGKVTEDVLNYFKFILDPANIENNGNEYIFRYTVTDKDGCTGTMENVVYSIIYPPEAVEEFEATQGARSIIISWNVSDSYYVEKYVLYRKLSGSDNWEAYRTITGKTSTYYEDTNVVMGQEYDYYIVAVDEFGQESEPSVILEKILPGADTEAPTVISLTPNDGSTICGTQDLTAYLYDNIGITKTEFYYSVDDGASWQLLNTYESSATTVTHSLDTTAIAAEVIKVKVITYDVDNNPSNGLVVRSYKIDNEGPDKVTGVAGNADSSTQITLTWNDVEAEDRAYFIVEQKNSDGTFSVVGNKVYDVAGMHIKNLTPGGEYIFRVVAYDKVGNRGIESDECVVSTKLDEQIPVVTKITPDPMKIAEALEMTFVVTDDYAVEKITVQTSTDGIVWNDVEVIPAATKAAKVTFSYTLSIDGYDDGLIWVRAVPMDTAGNENTAPIYNQYMIDTTAPLAPQNVTAIGTDSYIEIKWDEANIEIDDDVTHYIVERSEMEGGLYTVLSDNVTTINYLDYDVKSLTTYFYKVYAVDDMGNVSESSEIVSASKLVDNTPPVIEGILPGNGSRINSSREIEVYTSDNNAVASVTLQYKPADGGSWKTVGTGTAEISDFSLSELNLAEGEYMFRANATDTTGNVCEWSDTYTYTLDNTAPLISNVTVEPDAKSLVVSWNCEPYEDLNGTYLYYRTTDSTSYILAGRRQPSESGEYTCTIEGLSSSKSYVVKISAIDQAGNEAAFETNKSGEGLESGVDGSGGIGLDTSEEENVPLEISINAPSDLTVGAEAKFELKVEKGSIDDVASCSWDFGDGTTSSAFSVTHSYDTTDTFTVTLTAYDKNGNKATAAKEVTVSEAEDLGKVILSVIDDTGSVVPDAMVVFNCTDSEKMVHYTTDSTGKLTITAAPGEYEIGFYKDGYLPAQKRVKIINNAAEEKIVGIVKKNIVIGELTWKRMTLAEIEEAGIDTTDQANNNMFKYEMTLVIGTQPVKIQGYKPEGDNTPIRVTDADFTVPGSSGNGIYDSSGRLTSNTMYVYDFNDKSNGYNYNSETDKNRAPQTIVTYVQVPGEVTWLKEFFDVSLSVFNQAEAKFIIKDCSASLIYPTDGLTLDSKTPQTVSMGDIAGQSSQTANWILRGDTEGEYPIKADFKGDLGVMENEVFTSWDIPISQIFESERPIKVYGSEGLSFVIECENEVVALTDSGITDGLAFRVGLKNGSVLTRYMTGASVAETEDDNIIPLTGYQNYIENSNGDRYADSSELKYGETVYSDYIITGLDSTQDIKELIINRLREASAYPNLPLEFKEAAPRTFHSRRIEAYGIDENGEKLPVNVVSVKEDESMTFAVHITELLPGAEEYTDCSGIDVYVNGEYEGKTDEYGVLEYTYTAPAYNAKKSNQKLTFQGERTAETSIMIQVLDNTTYLKGYVHDTYGNILRDVAVKISSVAKDGTEEVVAETTTDRRGLFTLKDGIKAGTTKIELTKDKYKPLSETVELAVGNVTLMYKMEKIRQKPKIVSVTPKKIGDKSEKIIIPEGLNLSDILVVETNTEESGRLTGIRLEKVSSSGEVTEINNSATSQVILETEKLSAGDTVRVVAIADSNLESEPYVLPITVKAAPFTHLLNNGSVSASYGELNAKMSFANLFKNIPDRERNYAYWLSGDAKEAWENLMAQFDTKMVVDLGAGKLETNTEFTVDWFGYNSFTVYVNYNFATGELVVSPNPVGRKYYAYTSSGMCYDGAYRTNVKLENSRYGRTTGYIRVNEEVREDIGIPSGGRYGYLVTQSDRRYYIESLFGITFKLNGDQWAGMFEMSTDESNSSYGTYLKRLKWYKNIGSWNVPETIVASWYKSVNIKEDEDIPLTTEGINNANVSMKYNAANNATWYSGVGNIVLGSETSSTISILPYHRIQGATRLTGGYYIFRYWWPLYSSQNSYLPYDLNFGRTQLLAMDENTKLSSLSAVKLSNATGDNIVDGKVYANADAALADGQNPVMVYLDENGDKPQLVAQTFKNGVWGDATALEDDRDAYYPFVAQSGDGHIAVWTNYGNENGMPTDNGELTVDEIQKNVASEMDISYGVFRNGEWTDTRDLTKSDGYLDYSPVVTAFDNSAMAVWVRNTDNDIISEERNDNLMFSVMDENGDWSTAAEIEGADGTISDLSIAEKNGVVYILYAITEDMTYKLEDGTTHTEENLKKFYMMSYTNGSWSMEKCVNQTKSPDIFCSFVEIDGKQEIILVSATTIYRIDAASRDIIEIKQVSSEMEAANEMFVACDGTSMAVVWITGEEAQKIYAMVYNSETENWSEAVEVAEVCAGYTANNISAVFADGYIEIVYNRYMHDDEGTPVEVALCSANMPYSEDTLVIADVIEIEELTLADSVVMDGNNAKFNVKLKNNGAITLENYRITLKDTSGSVLSKEFEISGPLAGGAEQELELECAVEGLTSNITVNAYVADSTVSAAECEVVVENAAITELSANPTGDGSVLVTAVVKNTGYVPVSRTLALYNVTDGTEIAFTDVEGNELKAELTLNPQQEITAEFSIPAQSVAQTVDMKAMLIHNGVDEIDSEDDHKEITYTPSSRLVLGSVAPIFREDLFGKARNGSAITVNMDNIQVDVQEDGDIIADAAVEETENAATFGVMVPVNEDVKVVVSAPGFLPRTMSAYNYDEQVDMSLFPGDVYRDTNNTIDIFDLVYMIRRLGNTDLTEEELNNAKLTNDGTDNAITVNDMTVVLQNYGTGQRHYEELDERAAAEN